jgi:outer membrane lipoprotein
MLTRHMGNGLRMFWLLAAAALAGCASNPFADRMPPDLDRSITPQQAVKEAGPLHGKPVLWGGTIVTVHNLKDSTEVAVLAYPLDDSAFPKVSQQATGRFIIRVNRFIDPVDYAAGRLVSVLGHLDGVQDGKIGDAPYTFAVVQADDLHLWRPGESPSTHVLFGIGVGIGL